MSEYPQAAGYRHGPHTGGAATRAELYLTQAQARAVEAAAEPLPERREALLESARRLSALAETEMRLAARA